MEGTNVAPAVVRTYEPGDRGNGGLPVMIAALLTAVPIGERDSVLRRVRALAAGREENIPAPWAAIPNNLPIDIAVDQVRGWMSELSALHQASDTDSAYDVMRQAYSIATGVPMASDPSEVTVRPTVATALLDAASRGAFELSEDAVAALRVLSDQYDCHTHALPLGGAPRVFAGSILSDIFGMLSTNKEKRDAAKASWNARLEQKEADRAAKAAASEEAERRKRVDALMSMGYTLEQANALADNTAAVAATPAPDGTPSEGAGYYYDDPAVATGSDVNPEALWSGLSVDALKQVLTRTEKELRASKRQADDAVDELTRIAWANAVLKSSPDVVQLLAPVDPQFQSRSELKATAVNILAQLKGKSDSSTLGAVAKLLGLGRSEAALQGAADVLLREPDSAKYAKDLEQFFHLMAAHDDLRARPWIAKSVREADQL